MPCLKRFHVAGAAVPILLKQLTRKGRFADADADIFFTILVQTTIKLVLFMEGTTSMIVG